jgi:hypothetical protein
MEVICTALPEEEESSWRTPQSGRMLSSSVNEHPVGPGGPLKPTAAEAKEMTGRSEGKNT